jgi:ribulose-5-phosphate 4-epimerase/fuculose-1-phosphate aldolase
MITDLNFWRTRLFDEGLIGAEASGIGFGNVSIRIQGSRRFVISGTQTGCARALWARQYAKVVDWCIAENRVVSVGEVAASSESLSHGAAYAVSSRVGSVLHVHSRILWETYMDRMPTTARSAEAGTPEMAREIERLVPEALDGSRMIVMGGHRNGIISLGASPAAAAEPLLDFGRSSTRLRRA